MKDTSKAHCQNQIEVIYRAVSDGTLTAQQIHNLLLSEMAKELEQPAEEVDMEYVNACEVLLSSLNHVREAELTSHYVSNLAAIQKKLRHYHTKQGVFYSWKYAVACCIVFIIIFAGVLLPADRIVLFQTPDQGQFIMQGIETPSGFGCVADAGPALEHLGLHDTTDWHEVISLVGGIPQVPRWVAKGWTINMYSLDLTDSFSRLSITYYCQSKDEVLVYEVCTYFAVDDLLIAIEQNQAGEEVRLKNGMKVYIVSNINHNSATWYDNHTDYLLTGAVTDTELVKIIESIE